MAEKPHFAVFIDYDNVSIGVRDAQGLNFDYGSVRDWLLQRGEIFAQVAYGNWNTHVGARSVSRTMANLGVRMEHLETARAGSKNGADIALSLDALELVFTQEHIDAYCIVSGDSDFLPLVHKLKRYNKRVVVVAGVSFTSDALRRNCHEFVSYESLSDPQGVALIPPGETGEGAGPMREPIRNAVPAVGRAIREMRAAGEITYINQIRSKIARLDPDFDERRYGFEAFKDLMIRLVNAGHFEREMIGEHRFCIVEPAAEAGSRFRRDRSTAAGHVRPSTSRRSRLASTKPTGRETARARDPVRALAVVEEAVRDIESRGKRAELDLLFRTVTDIDSRFREYGSGSTGFRSLLSGFVADGRLQLTSSGGGFAVALVDSDDASIDAVLEANRDRLRTGVSRREFESMIRGLPDSEAAMIPRESVSALLAQAVQIGRLTESRDSDGMAIYSLPSAEGGSDGPGRLRQESATGPSAGPQRQASPGRDESAVETEPGLPQDTPSAAAAPSGVGGGAHSLDEAVHLLVRSLTSHSAVWSNGMTRSALRSAIREADPEFETGRYGVRSFREVLDRVEAKGYLESRTVEGEGVRYHGTEALARALADRKAEVANGAGRGQSRLGRLLGGMFRARTESPADGD